MFVVKKKDVAPREFKIEEPSPDELTLAVNMFVVRAQRIAYTSEFKAIGKGTTPESPLFKVRPYIDDQGVLRVGGRIVTLPSHFIYAIRLCCRIRLWLASASYEPFTSRTRGIRPRGGRYFKCSLNTGLRFHAVSSVVNLPHHTSGPFGDGVRTGCGFFHLCLRELPSSAWNSEVHPLRQRD